MRTARPLGSVLAAALLLGALLAGCAQEDPEKAEAQEAMCGATDRLEEALRNFTQTDRENRSEQMAAARDELFDAMAEMAHASSDVAEAEGADSSNPVTQLNQDLQDIEDDATVTEVAQGMATSAGDFLEGVKGFIQDREC